MMVECNFERMMVGNVEEWRHTIQNTLKKKKKKKFGVPFSRIVVLGPSQIPSQFSAAFLLFLWSFTVFYVSTT